MFHAVAKRLAFDRSKRTLRRTRHVGHTCCTVSSIKHICCGSYTRPFTRGNTSWLMLCLQALFVLPPPLTPSPRTLGLLTCYISCVGVSLSSSTTNSTDSGLPWLTMKTRTIQARRGTFSFRSPSLARAISSRYYYYFTVYCYHMRIVDGAVGCGLKCYR